LNDALSDNRKKYRKEPKLQLTTRQPTEGSSALPAETAVQAGKLIDYTRYFF